jgi:hypothetical protein
MRSKTVILRRDGNVKESCSGYDLDRLFITLGTKLRLSTTYIQRTVLLRCSRREREARSDAPRGLANRALKELVPRCSFTLC